MLGIRIHGGRSLRSSKDANIWYLDFPMRDNSDISTPDRSEMKAEEPTLHVRKKMIDGRLQARRLMSRLRCTTATT